jgi:hypothetical protein
VAGLVGLVVLGATGDGGAAPLTLRLALLSQSIVDQHRASWLSAPGRPMRADFLPALSAGVVDRAVLRWQHGVIQRSALILKPIRAVAGDEAVALGGRGSFQLGAVRPPRGAAAWTEIDVEALSGAPDDVLVLEVGGEINTIRQVLGTLFVFPAGRSPEEWRLVKPALYPGAGVIVIQAQFGLAVSRPDAPGLFRGPEGLGALVVRSLVPTVTENAQTTNGAADLSPVEGGAWREGDRVLLRIPLGALQGGVPPLALGWKDRIYQDSDPRTPPMLTRSGSSAGGALP